jgi:type I restriction enzyme S subunit
MRKVRLSEVCDISSGGTPSRSNPEYFKGDIPWAKISDIENAVNGVVQQTEEHISAEGLKNIRGKLFPKGTLLFAMYGSIGKVGICGRELSTNQAILGIRPKSENEIDLGFLKTWFASNKQRLINQGRGAALKNLSATIIRDLEVNLPSFDDQIRIAHLLGKVEGLIAQRKQHLKQLDDLLKSVFLEMFGDQIFSGPFTTLGAHITILSDYHANGSYETLKEHVQLLTEPNYALMVRTTDLENKNFSDGCNYITREAYEFLRKSKVYGGEIIINKIGSAGKVYLMPELLRPVSLGMNAFLIRFNEDFNNTFAYYFLTSDVGTQRIQKLVKGAVTKTITKEAIRSIAIPVITSDSQRKFAVIAKKTERLKLKYQQNLSHLGALYRALSQQAFKSELDLSRVELTSMQREEVIA